MNRRVSFKTWKRVATACAVVATAISLVSCGGSGRSSVEGYTDIELNDKRVFILMPDEGGYQLTDPAAFAWSRGISEVSAEERIYNEFRTNLTNQLDSRYDSNTVHNFAAQSVGATNPLKVADFSGAVSTWDWGKIEDAMKVGAIDFLVILSGVTVENYNPGLKQDRGKETVRLTVSLIDLPNKRMMLKENVNVSLNEPRVPSDTYVVLAREIAEKLPFYNRAY